MAMTSRHVSTDALLCNQCGAQLRIEESTKFVICSFCGCQLKVLRSGGGIYSEIIEEIQQRQDQTDHRIRTLELENDLLRLDQEWDQTKQRYLIHPDKGRPYLPDEKSGTAGAIFGVIFGIVFFLVFINVASQIGGSAFLFGLPVIGIVLFSILNGNAKRDEYRKAKEHYQQRRSRITAEIARLRPGQSAGE